jgi:hypothetical protein
MAGIFYIFLPTDTRLYPNKSRYDLSRMYSAECDDQSMGRVALMVLVFWADEILMGSNEYGNNGLAGFYPCDIRNLLK